MKKLAIFVALVFLAVSMVANASQVILDPIQDTYIQSFYADDNFGSEDTLWIGHHYWGWLDSLIQFDLSPYSGVIVESAYLRLYVYMQVGAFPPIDIWMGRVTGSWDEMTVSWNTFPGMDDSIGISGPASLHSWWVIDVATYVENWVGGVYGNFGFALGTYDDNPDYLGIHSKEWSDSDLRPQLELNYHDVSVQPTSLGSIKAIYK